MPALTRRRCGTLSQEELPQVFGVMHSSVAQHDENSAWTWVRQNADAIRGEDGPKIQIICGEVRCHTRGLCGTGGLPLWVVAGQPSFS